MLLFGSIKETLMTMTWERKRGFWKEDDLELCHPASHGSRKDPELDHLICSDTPVRGVDSFLGKFIPHGQPFYFLLFHFLRIQSSASLSLLSTGSKSSLQKHTKLKFSHPGTGPYIHVQWKREAHCQVPEPRRLTSSAFFTFRTPITLRNDNRSQTPRHKS